jgi:hypothetical protein
VCRAASGGAGAAWKHLAPFAGERSRRRRGIVIGRRGIGASGARKSRRGALPGGRMPGRRVPGLCVPERGGACPHRRNGRTPRKTRRMPSSAGRNGRGRRHVGPGGGRAGGRKRGGEDTNSVNLYHESPRDSTLFEKGALFPRARRGGSRLLGRRPGMRINPQLSR